MYYGSESEHTQKKENEKINTFASLYIQVIKNISEKFCSVFFPM